MRVTVHITPVDRDDEDVLNFPNAGGWHIDDHGHLHIKGPMHGDGNIATIRHDVWRGVAKSADETQRVDEITVSMPDKAEEAKRALRHEQMRMRRW